MSSSTESAAQVAEAAARNLLTEHGIQNEFIGKEAAINSLAWELISDQSELVVEHTLAEFAAQVIAVHEAQRSGRRVLTVPSAGLRLAVEQPGEVHEAVTDLLDTGYTLDQIEWETP